MATLAELNTLINTSTAHLNAFKAIALAYEFGSDGVPNIDGSIALVNNAISTNFGAGTSSGITFNQENIYINIMNAQIQGNAAAAAKFASVTAGSATLTDKLIAIYNAYVPVGAQTAEGRAFFTRPDAQAFYTQVAADRGVAGADGAAIVALASLFNILVNEDRGLGDAANDLVAAIGNDTAVLPESGSAFTPIETADGTDFDIDDNKDAGGQTFTLTTANGEIVVGTAGNDKFNVVADGAGQTLNLFDEIDGADGEDTLNYVTTTAGAVLPTANQMSNVENIIVTAGVEVAALDASGLADVTSLTVLGAGATAVTLGAGQSLTLGNSTTTAAGVTVTVDAAETDTTITLDDVAVGEQITLVGAANTTWNVVGSIDGGGLLALNAAATTETLNLELSTDALLTVAGAGLLEINGSESTGDLTINAVATVETVIGGSGDDTLIGGAASQLIEGGAGKDTITAGGVAGEVIIGGAGADTINLAANDQTVVINAGDSGITVATADTVTNFTTAVDKLDFNLAAGSVTNFVTDNSAGGYLDALVNANTAFASDSNLLYVASTFGGNTVVFVDSNGDGSADISVQLTGVAALNFADIIA